MVPERERERGVGYWSSLLVKYVVPERVHVCEREVLLTGTEFSNLYTVVCVCSSVGVVHRYVFPV